MVYCAYYQAYVVKKETWFLVATLRSFEHLAFDRTFDKEKGIFEFFVPHELETFFDPLLRYYITSGVIVSYEKLSNRLVGEEVV
jgi:hypothetical protein